MKFVNLTDNQHRSLLALVDNAVAWEARVASINGNRMGDNQAAGTANRLLNDAMTEKTVARCFHYVANQIFWLRDDYRYYTQENGG